MFKHNLTVSFRNMWKYKTQTIISIIGLAVGFTCFSLATLWMRYENTFDNFHKNAKNLYVATEPNSTSKSGLTLDVREFVLADIKKTFPEVKEVLNINHHHKDEIIIGERKIVLSRIETTSAFMTMFDVKILEGSLDFEDETKVAITKEKAQTIFGTESPIGKQLSFWGKERTISAVVSGYSNHSNFPFDILSCSAGYGSGIIELHPNVDVEAFKQKLYEHTVVYEVTFNRDETESKNTWEKTNISFIPLTKLRTEDPTMLREIKFQHIKLFAWSGILVILCSLFNYLTLFTSRFKIRRKELALRIVCGASLWSLFNLLLVEFFITLLAAVLLGLMIMNFISPEFQKLSEIQMNLSSVYIELGLYILIIILLTILLFAFTLFIFRKYALNASIRQSNNQLFRKISIVSQLVISIGFVFCTAVMIKQVHYLHNSTDIGFEYKNRAYFIVSSGNTVADVGAVSDKIKQIPEITEHITGYEPLISKNLGGGWFTDRDENGKFIETRYADISKAFADFYGLQLVAGEMFTDEDPKNGVLINESALKYFGWHIDEAVGKSIFRFTVKGVIKNMYNVSPTVEIPPYLYKYSEPDNRTVIFKYTNRTVAETKLKELVEKDFPEFQIWIYDEEEAYKKFFKSEKNLIMMLNIMSAVCVLISIFGFFSLVSLSCEEKRKEIAIRKVNGADIHDIIAIFFKEYSLLLAIGAAIAFPLGYYIMKNWLEQYMNKTTIDAWIYAAILLAFATIIVICVGWRVYKTSRENPADVVKSE